MLRWALLLALLSTSALASRADRLSVSPRLDRRDRLGAAVDPGPSTVFFALTDPGNECSGDPVEGLTFLRATDQACADATMTTTVLGSGQPAIEPEGLLFGPGTWAATTDVKAPSPFASGRPRVVSATVLPWRLASAYVLFHLGSGAYGANDTASVLINSADQIVVREVNSSGVSAEWRTANASFPPGLHHVRVLVPPFTPPRVWVDGVEIAVGLLSGDAGARITSLPSEVMLGRTGTAGQYRYQGHMRDLCMSRDPVECAPTTPPAPTLRVLALGDSITSGELHWNFSTVPHPRYLQYLEGYGSSRVVNAGFSGYEVSQVYAQLWQRYGDGKGYDVVVLLAGVNDVRRQVPIETTWTNYQAIIDEALADGAEVVVSTVFPTSWGSYDPNPTGLNALNTLISDYATEKSLVFVDGYALMGDPMDPTSLNPLYDAGDGIHINEAGNKVFAQAVYEALNPPAPLADAGGSETLGWLGALAALGAAGAGVYAARRRSA